MSPEKPWKHFLEWFREIPELGIALDVSRMGMTQIWWNSMREPMAIALKEMEHIEAGDLANPDEQRRVGHYWLRDPGLAPENSLAKKISSVQREIISFSGSVLSGELAAPDDRPFRNLLLIGIGGSTLGPRFVRDALEEPDSKGLETFFIDNSDPDGIDRIFAQIGDGWPETLVLVISKSGSTPETRNGMLEVRRVFTREGLNFPRQAVAVTGEGSTLGQQSEKEGWLRVFPMWDWVGGRTSVTSAVGLLPAALQGIDTEAFLEGARLMDGLTRARETRQNPAALLALAWHHAGNGKGDRAMVVLPYKDRLESLSRFLQQLLMESLGKEKDLKGNTVEQGLTVYGNKGSADQHSYIQQLRDGRSDFFVTFIEVLEERRSRRSEVEDGISSGDYLQCFLLGTRESLTGKKRPSMLITLERLDPQGLGALIALFERAVGIYAQLIGINAYHQPGVETGKKEVQRILALKTRLLGFISKHPGKGFSAVELSYSASAGASVEIVFRLLEQLRVNGRISCTAEPDPASRKYSFAREG